MNKQNMKKLITLTLVFFINLIVAQEFSYGLVLGNNFYSVANNNGTTSMSTNDYNSITFGGYAEYNFTENTGVKTDVLLVKNSILFRPTKQPFEMNILNISPSFKYDFGGVYREGFYMLVGPKFSFITSIDSNGKDVKDSFETFNYGTHLGFGYRIFKYIDIQTRLEYNISPFFKLENGNKSNFFGALVSVNIDLAKLITN